MKKFSNFKILVAKRERFFNQDGETDESKKCLDFLRRVLRFGRDQSCWLILWSKCATTAQVRSSVSFEQMEQPIYALAREREQHKQRSENSEKAVTHRRNQSVKNFRKRMRQRANRAQKEAEKTAEKE